MSSGVSVVIPTRNRPRLLAATLASVLAQRDVELEVLVVDDGSDGGAQPVLPQGDARVRVIRHDRPQGVAAARNAGLCAARFPWVAFTDDDDPWAPDKLAAQLAALDDQPPARWSCVGALLVDARLHVIGYQRTYPPGVPAEEVAAALLTKNVVPGGGSSVVAATELVRDLGGFDDQLRNMADYDLWIRLALASPLAAVDRPLMAFRVHERSMSLNLSRIHEERTHIDDKYAGVRQERGIQPSRHMHFWIGDRYERAGHRRDAARSYLRARPSMGWNRVLRRVVTVPVPGAVAIRDRRRGARVPTEWADEDLSWLDALRAEEQL